MPKYDIEVRPADGNAFSIMGAVIIALRRERVPATEIEAYKEEATNGGYDNLLCVSMEWVNLQPTNPQKDEYENDFEDDGEI